MRASESTIWRYLRSWPLRLALVSVLLLVLMGCQAAPPVARVVSGSFSTGLQGQTAPESDTLPVVDLTEFSMNPQGPISAQSLRAQQLFGFSAGTQKARIKVRQVSDLGKSYLTFVVIRSTAQGTTTVYRAWYGHGSYDILWDGKDDQGKLVPAGNYEIALQKPGAEYRTAGFKTAFLYPEPIIEVAVQLCFDNIFVCAFIGSIGIGVGIYYTWAAVRQLIDVAMGIFRVTRDDPSAIQVVATQTGSGQPVANVEFIVRGQASVGIGRTGPVQFIRRTDSSGRNITVVPSGVTLWISTGARRLVPIPRL